MSDSNETVRPVYPCPQEMGGGFSATPFDSIIQPPAKPRDLSALKWLHLLWLLPLWMLQYCMWVPLVWCWKACGALVKLGFVGLLLILFLPIGLIVAAVLLFRKGPTESQQRASRSYMRPWGAGLLK